MWDWVEPVLQYGLAPATAAGAVLITQVRSDRREDRRRGEDRDERQKDRDHASGESAAVRRADLEERWRGDRRDAYAELLDVADVIMTEARRLRYTKDADTLREIMAATDGLVNGRLASAVARIEVIGSDRTRKEATSFATALSVVDIKVFICVAIDDTAEHRNDLNTKMQAVLPARESFIDAVRADLGTA